MVETSAGFRSKKMLSFIKQKITSSPFFSNKRSTVDQPITELFGQTYKILSTTLEIAAEERFKGQ
jgi:hypothetical protein